LASVCESDSLRDVLSHMQSRGAHLARVLEPESRRTVGVVAFEDVVEELVGEVRDLAAAGTASPGD